MRPAAKQGQLRIIGGEWRGRKLTFPAVTDLRPTPDRVKETLFNWLQTIVPGARCLDLFAGSGSLGLEALSRGAAEVVMVEQDHKAAQQIRQHLATLKAQHGKVIVNDAFQLLKGEASQFDVVFLDPPYRLNCLDQCCQLLEDNSWLTQDARVYMEDSSKNSLPSLPPNWQLLREKKAGEVRYLLAARAQITNEHAE